MSDPQNSGRSMREVNIERITNGEDINVNMMGMEINKNPTEKQEIKTKGVGEAFDELKSWVKGAFSDAAANDVDTHLTVEQKHDLVNNVLEGVFKDPDYNMSMQQFEQLKTMQAENDPILNKSQFSKDLMESLTKSPEFYVEGYEAPEANIANSPAAVTMGNRI